MIENIIPKKFQIEDVVTAYSSIYVAHSSYADTDIVGKAYWINDSRRFIDTRVDRFYSVIPGLSSDTNYSIQGAYYDAMIDDELLNNKISIQLSDKHDFRTKKSPVISSYEVQSDQVDVGVGSPVLVLTLDGYADSYYVDYKVSGSTDPYSSLFTSSDSGASSLSIPMTTGTFDIRLVGKIMLPDGVTWDISTPFEIKNIKVEYKFTPPSAPDNITFKAAKIMDGIERYDLQVSWTWNKGSGANVREFVLYFVTEDEYNKTKWTKAQTVNGGASKAIVITGFPYDVRYKFKAKAVAWGPDKEASTESSEYSYIINKDTILDSSFTKATGIEVTYSHIKAYQQSNSSRYQTFLLDAGTGAMSIGKLDAQGVAPISVDPIYGNVNVDGSVIAKTIYSASFVMSNLTGKDNPEIRTASKKNYGAASDGLWMGYSKNDAKFKFDLGSSTKYIRWDGNNLVISGTVQIGTPGGNVDIGTGVQGNYIGFIYKASASKPTTPTGRDYPPAGWSIVPPTSSLTLWVSTALIDSKTNLVQESGSWSAPVQYSGTNGAPGLDGTNGVDGKDGKDGRTTYFHVAYADDANGGGFSQNPLNKKYIGTYVDYTQADSNDPKKYQWAEFKGADGVNGLPGVNGANGETSYLHIAYADTATGGGFSQSPTGKKYLGTYTDFTQLDSNDPSRYKWALIKGADGTNGTNGTNGSRGAGIYAQARNRAGWSDSDANSFFTSNFRSPPVKYDVLTQYLASNPTIATTKQWNGSSWGSVAFVVHGDAVVDGTLTARKLVADEAFLAKIGVNKIYNKDAAISSNPEANYKMKIDLLAGSIHIR